MNPSPGPLYRYVFDGAEFDEARLELKVEGEPRPIEPRPLEVLAQLIRRPGEVMSREELIELLWDGRPSAPNVLANAVKKLRTALGERAAARIVTLARMGYRFDGPVGREVVGRREAGETLVLEPGQAVPGRGDGCQLVRKLGRSSRHQVWRVWNAGLKVHRVFKFAADGEQLAALKRELTLSRFLLASLGPRDDLAVVLDANFNAEPYYLEFPDLGTDLLEWSASGQLQALERPQRLALFLQIAKTVDDAHALGVLHKDIKPSNILIRGEAGAWQTTLVDFGSGRLLDRRQLERLDLTAQGMTVTNALTDGLQGTYLYMAPELLQSQPPTVRSDLYALGVLLFQLLVGDLSRPQSTGWQRLIEDELLVADITAATEGAPQERMASVGELMNRVGQLELRHRQRQDQAELETEALRTRKALEKARLRRPWVAAAGISLVLGLCGVLWFYWQSQQSLRASTLQAQRAESIVDFLTNDVFQAADPTRPGAAARVPRSAKDVLLRAAEAAGDRFREQPETEARIHEYLARAFGRQLDIPNSDAAWRRAIGLYQMLLPVGDPRLLSARLSRAFGLITWQKFDEAQAEIDRVRRDAAPDLKVRDPLLASEVLRAMGTLADKRGDATQALAHAEATLDLLRHTPGLKVERMHGALLLVARLLGEAGRYQEADRLFTEACSPPFDEKTVGRYRLAMALAGHSFLASDMGDIARAETLLARTMKVFEPLEGQVPHFELRLYVIRANHLEYRGRLREAVDAYREAFDFAQRHGIADNDHALLAQRSALFLRIDLGDETAALLPELKRMHEANRRAPADGPDAAKDPEQVALHLARALTDTHQASKALPLLAALTPARLRQEDKGYDWDGRLLGERARALKALGQPGEAAALRAQALDRLRAAHTPQWVLGLYD